MSQQFAHYSSCLHRLTANHCACNVWKMTFINIMQEEKRKCMSLSSLIGIKRHHRICMMFEIQRPFNRLGGLHVSDPSYENTAQQKNKVSCCCTLRLVQRGCNSAEMQNDCKSNVPLLKGSRLLRKPFICGQDVKDVELRSVSNCPRKLSL